MIMDMSEQERCFTDLEALVVRRHAWSIAEMQNMDLIQLKQIINAARPDTARCVANITIGELVQALADLSSQKVKNGVMPTSVDDPSAASSHLPASPTAPDQQVLLNTILEILKDTVNNKKSWWVIKQLEDAINTEPPPPTIAEKVKRWRANWDKPDGVVLVWDAQPYGWKNELRNPEHERPGAVAIDVDGSWWVARGGNDLDGAERWVNIYEAKQEKVR